MTQVIPEIGDQIIEAQVRQAGEIVTMLATLHAVGLDDMIYKHVRSLALLKRLLVMWHCRIDDESFVENARSLVASL